MWAPVAYVPNYAEDSVTVTVNPASCSNSISPTSRSHGAGAETGTVGVTAGAGCSWTASESLSWVSITAGSSGTGNGTVNYSVSSNSGGARSGTITIASQTFTVNQAGAACSYSISPTSASVSSAAGSGSVSVTAGAGCAWTSTSNDSWITRTGGASGSGNGTVTYSYTSNGGSARTGTLTIADQTFSLSQAGVVASPVLFVSPTFFSFIAPQGGPNPAAQALTITNIGPGGTMLNWTLSVSTATGGPWLSSSRSSGAESGGGGTATPAPSISVNVSGLAVGTYNGTISISSNGGSASIPVTLNISNAADFSISASPPSQNATVGILNVFYFDLTVTPSGGFASPVTLTRNTSGPCISAGLPCGSSTNFFSSSPVNPNDPAPQSTYEIWITPTTPGIYTITFTGTSGALTHSYNVALIVDPAPVCIAAGSGTGLTGSYYGSRMGAQDYSNWVRSQTDSQVNFNWGTGSPSGLGPNNYSVLWEGTVVPRCNETYTFYANADDGVTLTVNGSTIINSWTDSPGERTSIGVALTAGQSYTIRMQYYEHTGSAFAELRWSSASTPKALVATSQLFPRTCVNRALVSGSAAAGPISVGGTYPLSCNYGQITNSITAFSDATACPVNSPPFSGTTANFTCPAGSIAPRNAVNTCRLTFLPPDYFCAATSGVNSTQIVANPPDLVLEFVSSACVSNNSQITLRYRTTGTVQASTIQVYRDGALIFTDIAAPAPGVWKNWTNTGLTFNQSYSYTARSTLSGFNGTMSGAVAAVAPNCNPTPNVSVSISAITGTGCSLPSGVKNGCILTFRVLYQNVGGGPASSVLSMNDLSQNLIYQSGSLSCTISCSVLSATAGNVTFQTNVSLAAGAQFFASFNAQVQTSSAASRELANVRTHGQYNPGPAAFDVTYSLITSPSLVITPKIYEVAP
ncbi:MAG: hypothetical protein A2722_02375 [Candidatus Doudnabacteria bacterium RIFCSPHIGHO2_01_FULL_50_11]|uniref:PA14 domain-containing protein n=1 Tax=Candidatus Doudnabacteria bacterium RIFCSPHIGHO2_01_FULL_50_11 TaxID=1817828 RepID=A0A1F5PFJ6_9BACT|nr:MAG: hypothetical protein A2722_02375 [Candidatus Doudnabacteria bacterium RIFCSPHIGHO2_01_FULL_50_11]